jgi:hypothetical protein
LDTSVLRLRPNPNAKEAKNQLNNDEEDRDPDHHRNKNEGNWVTASRNAIFAVKDYPSEQASTHEERDEK